MSYEWLQKLKPADPVARSGNTFNPPKLLLVERVTKTLVITRNGQRWRRNDGKLQGTSGGWDSPRIVEWTPEMEEKVERAELEGWLVSLAEAVRSKEVTLTLDALRQMRNEAGK